MRRLVFLFGFCTILIYPLVVFAQNNPARAGTAQYLKEIGVRTPELSTPIVTEKREAFEIAQTNSRFDDPLGDIVDRNGVESLLRAPYADVSSAQLLHDNQNDQWIMTIKTGSLIPQEPSAQLKIALYMDQDADTTNNEDLGTRGNMDSEWSLNFHQQQGWTTGFRWYNPEPDFWAINKETAMTWDRVGDVLIFRIPGLEVQSASPQWRLVFAASDGDGRTHIDVVPGVGFPKPLKTQESPDTSRFSVPAPVWIVGILMTIALVFFMRATRQK